MHYVGDKWSLEKNGGGRLREPWAVVRQISVVTKYYIYSNSRKKIPFNILDLQRKIKETYNEQILVSRLNFSDLKFEKKWFSFKNLVK